MLFCVEGHYGTGISIFPYSTQMDLWTHVFCGRKFIFDTCVLDGDIRNWNQ